MTKKNDRVPDKALGHEFDDVDVPTYTGPAQPVNKNGQADPQGSARKTTDLPDEKSDIPGQAIDSPTASTSRANSEAATTIFERAGRAQPQAIPAEPPHTEETVTLDRSDPVTHSSTARGGAPRVESEPTTVLPRTAEPAYSERPHAEPTYADEPVPVESTGTHAGVRDDRADRHELDDEGAVVDARRGTIDWGILILRLLVGGYLLAMSLMAFFRLGGSSGLAGLEAEFASYALPSVLSIVIPSLQLAAGVFLLFGLITPLFSAVAMVACGFMATHMIAQESAGLNIFGWSANVALPLVMFVLAVVLQFTGPGLYSFDRGRSWARRPLASSWIFVVIAIAGAVALWWFGAGVNPLR